MLITDPIAKHWILNLAVNFPVPLYLLYPVVRVESLNVKRIPGFSPDDSIAALRELIDEKMIRISDAGSEVPADWDNIKASLQQSPSAPLGAISTFELTPSGGEAWENLADPDWN